VRRSVLTLTLLACLTFVAGLGRQAITDSDEAFYAEAAREMVESGDWLTPHFNYEDRWQKPPLYYWLTAATYVIAGGSEGAARFWSALSGVGLALLTWVAARRTNGPAWLAGAMVATCIGYFAEARLALPDLPLAFCITLTIWAAFRATDDGRLSSWTIAGVGAGLGLLIKGPVAIVVSALVLLPAWWLERASNRRRLSGVAVAAVIAAMIGLPWYFAMWSTHGTEYLRYFFVENNVERFATDTFNEPRPFWFYGPILLGGMLPWSAYLVAFGLCWLVTVVSGFRRTVGPPSGGHYARLSRDGWRLAFWALMPLLFFTISIGKQPRYILPVLPPVAILVAGAITNRIERADPGARNRVLAIATWATAALFAVFAVLLARAQPLFIAAYPALTRVGVALIAAAALAIAAVAIGRRWHRVPAVVALAAAMLLVAVQFGALSGRRPEAVEQMAALVHAHRHANEPVGEYEVLVRNLVFYLGFKQQVLFEQANVVDFVRSPDRVLLVMRSDTLAAVQEASGVNLIVLGRVPYLNAANLKVRTLIAPDPARDIDTVLLVANR
jgi:4-amino-4-deoxy-L-arabinose transferase-like glycosyltransferase